MTSGCINRRSRAAQEAAGEDEASVLGLWSLCGVPSVFISFHYKYISISVEGCVQPGAKCKQTKGLSLLLTKSSPWTEDETRGGRAKAAFRGLSTSTIGGECRVLKSLLERLRGNFSLPVFISAP